MFADLLQKDIDLAKWAENNPKLAVNAMRVGKTIIENGVEIIVEHIHDNESMPMEIVRVVEDYVRQNESLKSQLALNDAEHKMEIRDLTASMSKLALLEQKNADLEASRQELLLQLNETRKLVRSSTVSNSDLGKIGQLTVENMIRQVWPSAIIYNMSGVGQMSDIHVLYKSRRIVIECKNKQTITKEDVDKSLRDISTIKTTHHDFAAYCFISLESRAIPGKGPIKVEFINGIPVTWVGITSSENIYNIGHALSITAALISDISPEVMDDDDETLRDDVRKHIASLVKQKTLVAMQQDTVDEMRALVDEAMLRFHDLLPTINSSDLSCGKCKKIYKTRNGLTKHMLVCKK